MELFGQNDQRWKNLKFGGTQKTYGDIACLLVSLNNAENMKSKSIIRNPIQMHDQLFNMGGFTSNGLIIWDVVSKLMGCNIEPWYKGNVDYNVNAYYIAHFYMTDRNGVRHGHFSNTLEHSNFKYFIHDTWDNMNKIKNSNEVDRIVRIVY